MPPHRKSDYVPLTMIAMAFAGVSSMQTMESAFNQLPSKKVTWLVVKILLKKRRDCLV
jgi:hypothetical protein